MDDDDIDAHRLHQHDILGEIARRAIGNHIFDRLLAAPAERMHAGIDHQPHRAQHFAALERLEPFDRVVIEAELVTEAFGIEAPALAEGSEAAVAHEFGQVIVLDREHRLEVMPRIAFVHVEPDRSAQFTFGRVPPAEIEGARPRAVGLARRIAGGQAELLAIGFVRLDPQFGLGLAQEHPLHKRVDLFGNLVPSRLQIGLAGIGFARAAIGLGFGDVDTPRSQGRYRVLIFVNGWNMGQFVAHVGPQRIFPVPEGILNHRGENHVALAVTTDGQPGDALDLARLCTDDAPIRSLSERVLPLVGGVMLADAASNALGGACSGLGLQVSTDEH